MIAAFMVPQKRDFISRDDAKIAAWTILEGMGISAKHNERLVEEVDAVVDDIPAADVVPARDFRDCRNELCLRCGAYKQRHEGACDGCRWLVKTDDVIDRSLEELRP